MSYSYTGSLVLFNLFLWLILLLRYSRYVFSNRFNINRKGSYWFPLVITILFTTFAFSEPDTYHYHEIYDRMCKVGYSVHIEEVYFWLLNILPKNYYLWRFVIWGGASLLLIITFKRYNLNHSIVAFLLPVILMQQLAVTRGALGISIFLLATSFWMKPIEGRKVLSFLIGILGCIASLFFHRSMPLFILVYFVSFIPLTRFTISLLLILFPVFRVHVIPLIIKLFDIGLFNAEVQRFSIKYIEGERSVANLRGIIQQTVEYLPRFIIVYVIVRYVILKKDCWPSYVVQLSKYVYVLFYISLLFYGQEISSFMSSRTIHMLTFPLIVVFAYILSQNTNKTILRTSIILFVVAGLYSFLHSIYKWGLFS